jgi:hypothetical protein
VPLGALAEMYVHRASLVPPKADPVGRAEQRTSGCERRLPMSAGHFLEGLVPGVRQDRLDQQRGEDRPLVVQQKSGAFSYQLRIAQRERGVNVAKDDVLDVCIHT